MLVGRPASAPRDRRWSKPSAARRDPWRRRRRLRDDRLARPPRRSELLALRRHDLVSAYRSRRGEASTPSIAQTRRPEQGPRRRRVCSSARGDGREPVAPVSDYRCARCLRRNSLRTAAPEHGRPRVGPSMMQNSGPTGSSLLAFSHGRSGSQPPLVDPDLTSAAALAAADQDRSASVVEVVLSERERLLDSHPARHKTTIIARTRQP